MNPHTINIYSGGSYNEIHDCENVYLSCEKAEIRVDKQPVCCSDSAGETPDVSSGEPRLLPEKLLTDEAKELHEKLMQEGVLDKMWQPVALSNAEKGTLIEYISERLKIRAKWKFFGTLWNTDSETLRTSKTRGLEQGRTWKFRERLNPLFIPNPDQVPVSNTD